MKWWRKRERKRLSLLSVTVVFILAFIVQLLPIDSSNIAYAGYKEIIAQSIVKKQAAWNVLRSCLITGDRNGESIDSYKDITDFKWTVGTPGNKAQLWLDSNGNVIYPVDGTGMNSNCQSGHLKSAFNILGFSTDPEGAGEILCGLGYKQTDSKDISSSCLKDGFGQSKDRFECNKGAGCYKPSNYLNPIIGDENNPPLSKDAESYAMGWLRWVANDCTMDVRSDGLVPKGYQIEEVYNFDGSKMVKKTKLQKNPTSDIYVPDTVIEGNGCINPPDSIKFNSKQAQAFINAVNTQTKDGKKSWCNDKYNSSTGYHIPGTAYEAITEAEACVWGGEGDSCDLYKPSEELYSACIAGAGLSVCPDGSSAESQDQCPKDTPVTENPDDEGSDCNGGALGWILCPVVAYIEGAVDLVMGAIEGQLNFQGFNSTSNALKSAWDQFLPIANIAFVVVFMIIIYSTATSTGISNYGIKKIMPRLIVAAIMVNLSYYICAGLTDVSNIIGSSIKDLLAGIGDKVNGGYYREGFFANTAQIAGGIIGVAATSLGALLLIVLFWSVALLGIITVLATLAFRVVALAALVIISPVAFVLWLLPNTEQWFKRWLKEFSRMLFVYPALMAVWGASQMVTETIMSTGDQNVLDYILTPVICVLPVFAIMPIMKMGGSMMGMIAKATQGTVNKLGEPLRKINKGQREEVGQRVGRWGRNGGLENARDRVENSRLGQLGGGRVGRIITGGRLGGGAARLGTRAFRLGENAADRRAGSERATEIEHMQRVVNRADDDDRYAQQVGQGRIQAMRQKLSQEQDAEQRAILEHILEGNDYTAASNHVTDPELSSAGISDWRITEIMNGNSRMSQIELQQVLAIRAAAAGYIRQVRAIENNLAKSGTPGVNALGRIHDEVERRIRNRSVDGIISEEERDRQIRELRAGLGSSETAGILKSKYSALSNLSYDNDTGRTLANHLSIDTLERIGETDLGTQTAESMERMVEAVINSTTHGDVSQKLKYRAQRIIYNPNIDIPAGTRAILEHIATTQRVPRN